MAACACCSIIISKRLTSWMERLVSSMETSHARCIMRPGRLEGVVGAEAEVRREGEGVSKVTEAVGEASSSERERRSDDMDCGTSGS